MIDRDVLNDELERVYGLFGKCSAQFRRGLFVQNLVGLVAFALVVVPFLTFRDQVADLETSRNGLAKDIEAQTIVVDNMQLDAESLAAERRRVQAAAGRFLDYEYLQSLLEAQKAHEEEFETLRRRFTGSLDHGLVDWAEGRIEAPPPASIATSRELSHQRYGGCFWSPGWSHITCRACEDMRDLVERTAFTLRRLRSSHGVNSEAASADLEAVGVRACGWLTKGEAHWETGLPAPLSPTQLRGLLSRDIRAVEDRLEQFQSHVRADLSSAETILMNQQRSIDLITEDLAVAEQQLARVLGFERISTPIGTLPVGLGQLVLLYPVAVAFGFALVANNYIQLAQLRQAFARLCRLRDAEGEVIDSAHLAAIAPLWLTPRQSGAARAAKWGIIGLSLALVLADFWFIYSTEALTEQLPDDATISVEAYILLYVASLMLMLGSLFQIGRAAL